MFISVTAHVNPYANTSGTILGPIPLCPWWNEPGLIFTHFNFSSGSGRRAIDVLEYPRLFCLETGSSPTNCFEVNQEPSPRTG